MNDQLQADLLALGLTDTQLADLLARHSEEELQRQLDWLPARGDLLNPAAFYIRAVRGKYAAPDAAAEQARVWRPTTAAPSNSRARARELLMEGLADTEVYHTLRAEFVAPPSTDPRFTERFFMNQVQIELAVIGRHPTLSGQRLAAITTRKHECTASSSRLDIARSILNEVHLHQFLMERGDDDVVYTHWVGQGPAPWPLSVALKERIEAYADELWDLLDEPRAGAGARP